MFYPTQFKKEVVQYLQSFGITKTIKKYNIAKSNIYYWCYQFNNNRLGIEVDEKGKLASKENQTLDTNSKNQEYVNARIKFLREKSGSKDTKLQLENNLPIASRIDPRMILFICNVKELFPNIGRGKIKKLCDKFSFINNTGEISLSSIGRMLKRIKEG